MYAAVVGGWGAVAAVVPSQTGKQGASWRTVAGGDGRPVAPHSAAVPGGDGGAGPRSDRRGPRIGPRTLRALPSAYHSVFPPSACRALACSRSIPAALRLERRRRTSCRATPQAWGGEERAQGLCAREGLEAQTRGGGVGTHAAPRIHTQRAQFGIRSAGLTAVRRPLESAEYQQAVDPGRASWADLQGGGRDEREPDSPLPFPIPSRPGHVQAPVGSG